MLRKLSEVYSYSFIGRQFSKLSRSVQNSRVRGWVNAEPEGVDALTSSLLARQFLSLAHKSSLRICRGLELLKLPSIFERAVRSLRNQPVQSLALFILAFVAANSLGMFLKAGALKDWIFRLLLALLCFSGLGIATFRQKAREKSLFLKICRENPSRKP